MLTVVAEDGARPEGVSLLDDLVRKGARRMLAAALEAEVDTYLAELAGERDERGRRLVVRNGHAQPRRVMTGPSTAGRPPSGHQGRDPGPCELGFPASTMSGRRRPTDEEARCGTIGLDAIRQAESPMALGHAVPL